MLTRTNVPTVEPRNVSLYDPFYDLADLFAFPRMRMTYPWAETAPQIKMDVTEDDKVYHVRAEIPNVEKNDIHVSIDGNVVSIEAEVKRETTGKNGERMVRSELYYGNAARRFTLPMDVDAAKATAKYDAGMLDLMLPKMPGGASKSLPIQ